MTLDAATVARLRAEHRVDLSARDQPTARETDVLRLIAAGHSGSATAAALGIGHDTVRHRLSSLYSRIGAANAAHAVHIAHQRGWLS